MSIEDLMNVDVTSTSRANQRLVDAPAAVFVLTSEDIRRSGATNIPEALRLAPGVHVGRIDANKWSVSIRGFNGRYANKLLVLVDGRSVYVPLFSGVLWDTLNIPLDTIERIEVVRGPGGTLWGANAVNGVINIITRATTARQGVHVGLASGSAERGQVEIGATTPLGARTSMRFNAGASSTNATVSDSLTGRAVDDWNSRQVGFRSDSRLSDADDLVVQASFTANHINDSWLLPSLAPPFVVPTPAVSEHNDGFATAQWTRRGASGETTARASFEKSHLSEAFISEQRQTLDVDLQRVQHLGEANELVVGASYRRSADRLVGSSWLGLTPDHRVLQWPSAFAQNELGLLSDRVRIALGAKAEHNNFTGWEFQPNLRGLVAISKRQAVWASMSRAVRLPSRVEAEGSLWLGTAQLPDSPVPVALALSGLVGDPRAEVLVAEEAGYRYRFSDSASVEVSTYDSHYDHLRSVGAFGQPQLQFDPSPHLFLAVPLSFQGSAHIHGAEVSAEWRPLMALRVSGWVSWLHVLDSSRVAFSGLVADDDPPARQALLRIAANLPARMELDVATRYVSRLEASNVPAYVTADARLGFRLSALNLAVVGRNLAAARRLEYVPEVMSVGRAAAERSVLLQVTFNR